MEPGFSSFLDHVRLWEVTYLSLETDWATTLHPDTVVTDELANEFREAIIKGQQMRLRLLLVNWYARKEVQDAWVKTQKETLALFQAMDREADKADAARAALKADGSVVNEPVTVAAEGATVTTAGGGVTGTAAGESATAKTTELAASSEEAGSTSSTTEKAAASESTGEAESTSTSSTTEKAAASESTGEAEKEEERDEEASAASQSSGIGALAVVLVGGLAALFVL